MKCTRFTRRRTSSKSNKKFTLLSGKAHTSPHYPIYYILNLRKHQSLLGKFFGSCENSREIIPCKRHFACRPVSAVQKGTAINDTHNPNAKLGPALSYRFHRWGFYPALSYRFPSVGFILLYPTFFGGTDYLTFYPTAFRRVGLSYFILPFSVSGIISCFILPFSVGEIVLLHPTFLSCGIILLYPTFFCR